MSETNLGRTDCVVIGAGVIGLAVARALARAGRDVLVVEADGAIGTGTSSRNSEVIHAGLYYPEGSVKARFCKAGRTRLYAYCARHGIPHRRLGKLVVATSDAERPKLAEIALRAEANGVDDLVLLDAGEARRLEPELTAAAALLSPSTGIVDSHAFMLSLRGEAEDAGALFAFRTPVTGGAVEDAGIRLSLGGAEPCIMEAGFVVNAAGLAAHHVAASIDGVAAASVPAIRFAKGNYFGLSGKAPFSRLVYPVPEPGGLGVHLTLDMAGRARFGPDVEWIEAPDYRVAPERAEPFYAAIRRYWPALPDGALYADYAGIRVKVPGGESDFVIATDAPGLISLYGIESPGLTASLAIADHIAGLAG